MSDEPCAICCEIGVALVVCDKCFGSACIVCTKKFIFEGVRKYASCMHCNAGFTKEFIFRFFPSAWISEYKLYQKKFAIDRERSKLISSLDAANEFMMQVSEESRIDEVIKKIKEYEKIIAKIKKIQAYSYFITGSTQVIDKNYYKTLSKESLAKSLLKDPSKNDKNIVIMCVHYVYNKKLIFDNALKYFIAIKIKHIGVCGHCENDWLFKMNEIEICIRCCSAFCKKCKNYLHDDIAPCCEESICIVEHYKKMRDDLKASIVSDQIMKHSKPVKKKNNIIAHQCNEPSCNGYVYDNGVCALCAKVYCTACQELEHEGKCNKEILSTINAIKNDTKPCPVCYTRVFRIAGCYQMFCTACNNAFDWESGKEIVNETIHNPHYTEYLAKMREKNKQKQDAPTHAAQEICGPNNAIFLFARKPLSDLSNLLKNLKDTESLMLHAYTPSSRKFVNRISDYLHENNPIYYMLFNDLNPCTYTTLSAHNYSHSYYNRFFIKYVAIIEYFYQRATELRQIVTRNIYDHDAHCHNLRVRLLTKQITDEQFNNQIGLAELRNERYTMTFEIYNNFWQIIYEYLSSMTKDTAKETIIAMYDFWINANEALIAIGELLKMKVSIIPLFTTAIGYIK
jgi:hypothetical protein